MKLQNKFKDIISHHSLALSTDERLLAKECTKLCLEEQVKLLAKCGSNHYDINYIDNYIENLQQQLKQLENESMKSKEILPEERRDKTGNNYDRSYVNLIFKALEAAEEELIKLQEEYNELLRRYDSERNLSQKYIKLGKADERYNKALESLKNEDLFPNNCVIEKALKIAAYG